MALTAANVAVGVSGEVLVGPTTATPPTTAAAATTGYVGLGYISDSGIEPARDKSTNDITAWQNAAIVRTTTTGAKTTYTFTLIETTKAVIEFAFGTTVTQSAAEGKYAADPSATGGTKNFIIDVVDGANIHRETFQGELTEMTPTAFVSGEPIGYECTVTAYTVPQVSDTRLKTP